MQHFQMQHFQMQHFQMQHFKNAAFPNALEILRVRVEDAFQPLKNDREMIRRAVGGLMNRANTCLERNGSHVEGY